MLIVFFILLFFFLTVLKANHGEKTPG